MPLPETAERLQDTAALWSVRAVTSQAMVACACDALVAGLDSPSLRILAGLTRREADYEVPEVLPAALAELGLAFHSPGSPAGEEAAARALAAQAVSGSLTPRELAAAIHQHFGHALPLAERLAHLDDEYDMGAYSTMTLEQIDQEVMAEARQLVCERARHLTAQNDGLRAMGSRAVPPSEPSASRRIFRLPGLRGSAERDGGRVRPRHAAVGSGWRPAGPGRTRPAARRPNGPPPGARERLPRERPDPDLGPRGAGSGAERGCLAPAGAGALCSVHGYFPESGKYPRFRVQVLGHVKSP